MVWLLEPCEGGAGELRHFWAGTFTVGRKDADILMTDRAVSRKHAVLEVGSLPREQLGDVHAVPSLHITSHGQFGTLCQPASGENPAELHKGIPTELRSCDELKFGWSQNHNLKSPTHRVRHLLVVFAAPAGSASDATKNDFCKAGIHLLERWDTCCTHLLLSPPLSSASLEERAAALAGRLGGIPIVSDAWVNALSKRTAPDQPLPDPSRFPVEGVSSTDISHSLLSGYIFVPSGVLPTTMSSFLLEAIKMAGGQVAGQGQPLEEGQSKAVVQVCNVKGHGGPEEALWTTPELIVEALECNSTASMVRQTQCSTGSFPPPRPHCFPASSLSKERMKRERGCDVDPGEGQRKTDAEQDSSGKPAMPKRQRACEERVDADGDAAAPPIPNTANMLGQAGHAMECGAEAITANGRAPKAEDGCAAGNAEGMGKKARMANPEPECKPKHAADGPWIVSKKPLIVRRYDPVASAVVRRVDGVSVLPNFKRFQKVNHAHRASSTTPRMQLSRYVQPIVNGTIEFLEEERAEMRSKRAADDLFHAQLRAVKARPLPDPDADEPVADHDAARESRARPPARMQAAPVTSEVDVEQLAADGKLKSLKVDVLKAYLKKHRLPVGGKKEDLIQRITRHVM